MGVKAKTILDSKSGMVVAGIAALAVVGYFAAKKTAAVAQAAASDVGNAVNPVNQDNVFHAGTNAVGEAVTGEKGWTLGGQIYDWLHPQSGSVGTGFAAGGYNPAVVRDGPWNQYDRSQLKMQGASGFTPM